MKEIEESRVVSLKKNLRRKLMSHLTGFNFVDIQRCYFVYPETLQIQEVIKKYIITGAQYCISVKMKKNPFEIRRNTQRK